MSTPKAYATLWVGLSGRKDEKAHWKSLVHDREGRLDAWFGDEVELPCFDDATWARAWLLSHPGERAVVEVEAAKQVFGEDRALRRVGLSLALLSRTRVSSGGPLRQRRMPRLSEQRLAVALELRSGRW